MLSRHGVPLLFLTDRLLEQVGHHLLAPLRDYVRAWCDLLEGEAA